jgi:hypothetical protein
VCERILVYRKFSVTVTCETVTFGKGYIPTKMRHNCAWKRVYPFWLDGEKGISFLIEDEVEDINI